jgi:protein tyrosine phosphatase (PTP) superfamily phosphohydrolase (DUF442 family)
LFHGKVCNRNEGDEVEGQPEDKEGLDPWLPDTQTVRSAKIGHRMAVSHNEIMETNMQTTKRRLARHKVSCIAYCDTDQLRAARVVASPAVEEDQAEEEEQLSGWFPLETDPSHTER